MVPLALPCFWMKAAHGRTTATLWLHQILPPAAVVAPVRDGDSMAEWQCKSLSLSSSWISVITAPPPNGMGGYGVGSPVHPPRTTGGRDLYTAYIAYTIYAIYTIYIINTFYCTIYTIYTTTNHPLHTTGGRGLYTIYIYICCIYSIHHIHNIYIKHHNTYIYIYTYIQTSYTLCTFYYIDPLP